MARPTRIKIKFDEESLNELAQEIYNESHNIKAKLGRLFTKWEDKVKEGGEIAAIGDQIVKLIAVETKNQDQKIMLLKYLKEIVFRDKGDGGDGDSGNKGEVSATDRNALIKMAQQELLANKKTDEQK